MCIVPKEEHKFLEFINIVRLRLKSHDEILTQNRLLILEILYVNSNHLCVNEIVNYAKVYKIKLTLNTIYKILSFLETFNIIDSIVIDNKKRYELTYLKKPHYHMYCSQCHTIEEFSNLEIHDLFLNELKKLDFQPTGFNVIINGICKKCKNL